MLSEEEIARQHELLRAHRRTLAVYLRQLADLGRSHAPPGVIHGIEDARAEIQTIKNGLRAAGVPVADQPIDRPTDRPPEPNPGRRRGPWFWFATGAVALAVVGLGDLFLRTPAAVTPTSGSATRPPASPTRAPASAESSPPAAVTPTSGSATRPPASPTRAPANAESPPPVTRAPIAFSCFTDLAPEKLVRIGVSESQRFGAGFPEDERIGIAIIDGERVIGGLLISTLASSSSFRIEQVVDAECQPITGYADVQRGTQQPRQIDNWSGLRMAFGDTSVGVRLGQNGVSIEIKTFWTPTT